MLLSALSHISAGLKRKWDQKLSTGLMGCQFKLAITGYHWSDDHPSLPAPTMTGTGVERFAAPVLHGAPLNMGTMTVIGVDMNRHFWGSLLLCSGELRGTWEGATLEILTTSFLLSLRISFVVGCSVPVCSTVDARVFFFSLEQATAPRRSPRVPKRTETSSSSFCFLHLVFFGILDHFCKHFLHERTITPKGTGYRKREGTKRNRKGNATRERDGRTAPRGPRRHRTQERREWNTKMAWSPTAQDIEHNSEGAPQSRKEGTPQRTRTDEAPLPKREWTPEGMGTSA